MIKIYKELKKETDDVYKIDGAIALVKEDYCGTSNRDDMDVKWRKIVLCDEDTPTKNYDYRYVTILIEHCLDVDEDSIAKKIKDAKEVMK